MYNVTAFAFPLSPTTPQASVASIITPSDPALGRLPVQTVAATVSDPAVRNDSRNAPAFSQAMDGSPPPVAPPITTDTPAARMTDTRISSFPSLFFAQLLSQGMDEQTQSLVISYETMLEFGNVKYKPSNAGQPAPASPMLDFLKTLNAETTESANRNPPTPVAANANAAAKHASSEPSAAFAAARAMPAPAAPAPAKPAPAGPSLRVLGGKAYGESLARIAAYAAAQTPAPAPEEAIPEAV